MAVWFVTIAVLGVWGIAQYPAVLAAINPYYALHYLLTHGYESFLVLGGVFLSVTGAEALYADMGHFGPKPIRVSWSIIVFPVWCSLCGQSAIALRGASVEDIFSFSCVRLDAHRTVILRHWQPSSPVNQSSPVLSR